MRAILICSTKPKLKPLAICSDRGDAQLLINSKLQGNVERFRGAVERMELKGGAVSPAGVERWASAQCTEIELPNEWFAGSS